MTDDAARHDFRAHGDGELDVERATKSGKPRAEQDPDLESTFQASVEEGTLRVRRTLPTLLATGLVGGVDVSLGVVALLVVEHETGSKLLGALAFMLSRLAHTPKGPTPIGLFRQVQRPVYGTELNRQLDDAIARRGQGDLTELLAGSDSWMVS